MSKRRLVTAVFISASVASFATLGDGGFKKTPTPNQSLLAFKPNHSQLKTFTLKSTYNYRGNLVFSMDKDKEEKYILMNTSVTYQKGNSIYTLPLKKKVLLNKVKLGSTSAY